MESMHEHDVIVVGAGPAGSTTGYLLARAGIDVLVIDRADFPRPKTCGGAVTWRMRRVVESIIGGSFPDMFPLSGRTVRFEIFERRRLMVRQLSPEPFYFVDRFRYDLDWMERARGEGCRIRLGDPVRFVDPAAGTVVCRSGLRLRARIVVGADGANSLVRRCLFPGYPFKHDLGIAFQSEVSRRRLKPAFSSPAPKILLGDVRCGYGWIFPGDDKCVIGLCGLVRKNPRPAERFRRFSEGVLVEGEDSAPAVHPVPVGNFLEDPGRGHILLVGDAAGFADPLTGEGLYFAHRSAALAAGAIEAGLSAAGGPSPLSRYRAALAPIYEELRAGLRLRDLAYGGARYLGYLFARSARFYSLLAEGIHGIRRFSSLPFLSR